MTPAETLAASKPYKTRRPPVWRCTIIERRKALGLTIREIGEAVGMTNAAISVIERGQDPLLTTAKKLADFFGVSISELWPEMLSRFAPTPEDAEEQR